MWQLHIRNVEFLDCKPDATCPVLLFDVSSDLLAFYDFN